MKSKQGIEIESSEIEIEHRKIEIERGKWKRNRN